MDQITSSIASDAEACVERCAPLADAIAAAKAGAASVCDIARGIDDADARTRCERGNDRSVAIQREASDLRLRCGCGPAAAP